MDELIHFLITDPDAKKAVIVAEWVAIGILVVLAVSIVISIIQGRPFRFWQISLGGHIRKHNDEGSNNDAPEQESPLIGLPQSYDELEDIIHSVWNEAVEAESNRFWNILTLLRDVYVFDNTVLLRLSEISTSPYEVWRVESRRATKSFKDIEKSIEIAMKVISDVTRGDDTNSKRRGSIALKNKDGFLYIVMRDHHSQANEKREKFLVSDKSRDAGVAGYVAYSKKSLRVPNVLDESKFINFHSTPKYKSLLCVPIMVNDFVFGTFSIDSTAENAYTQEEEELANIFANSIATALIALMLRYAKHLKR